MHMQEGRAIRHNLDTLPRAHPTGALRDLPEEVDNSVENYRRTPELNIAAILRAHRGDMPHSL
eukprot:7604114-Pyramimonas_sp.AAC.1